LLFLTVSGSVQSFGVRDSIILSMATLKLARVTHDTTTCKSRKASIKYGKTVAAEASVVDKLGEVVLSL
jgi:hypothetical protein